MRPIKPYIKMKWESVCGGNVEITTLLQTTHPASTAAGLGIHQTGCDVQERAINNFTLHMHMLKAILVINNWSQWKFILTLE